MRMTTVAIASAIVKNAVKVYAITVAGGQDANIAVAGSASAA